MSVILYKEQDSLKSRVNIWEFEEPEPQGLIIDFKSGVHWHHQCGGPACELKSMEGIYIPMRYHWQLTTWMETAMLTMDGSGASGYTQEQLEAVEAVLVKHPGITMNLDYKRAQDLRTGWVPVVLEKGLGVFVWSIEIKERNNGNIKEGVD